MDFQILEIICSAMNVFVCVRRRLDTVVISLRQQTKRILAHEESTPEMVLKV